jgi:hypothetical protein
MKALHILFSLTLAGTFVMGLSSYSAPSISPQTTIWIRRDAAINDNLINAGTTLILPGNNILTVTIVDNREGQSQTRTAYYANGTTPITASEPDYASDIVIY